MDKSKNQKDNDVLLNQKINSEDKDKIPQTRMFKDIKNQDLQVIKLSIFDNEENIDGFIEKTTTKDIFKRKFIQNIIIQDNPPLLDSKNENHIISGPMKELNDQNKSALKSKQKINQALLNHKDKKIIDSFIFKKVALKKFDLTDNLISDKNLEIFNNKNLNNKSAFIEDNPNLRTIFNTIRTRDKEMPNINMKSKTRKKLKDYEKLNTDKNFKSYSRRNNNELIQEEILQNSHFLFHNNSIKNDSSISPVVKKLFIVEYCDNNSRESEKKRDKLIKKKRDIVKEKIKHVIKEEIKLDDIEKYIYREFKDYLKENRDKFQLYNCFWDVYFTRKIKNEPILIYTKNGEKLKFKSYSHDLMKLLFSINDTLDLYEKFLEDKNFHFNYLKRKKITIYCSI